MKKKVKLINCILVIICSLSGCNGDKEVSYEAATSSQLTEEVAFVDDIEVPDHLDMTIEGASSRTVIDADIILPDGYKNCTVVECIDRDFTDEDKKNMPGRYLIRMATLCICLIVRKKGKL